jgi:O-antigen ligase/polysaccharide polymerase Wzy-like membrane protein
VNRERAAGIVKRNPGLLPSLLAISVVLWFAADKGGFRGTTWMPATLLLGAGLVVCLAALPRPRPARAALAAILLLAGYGVFCLLSMLWADQPELAWDAGNRTLLYTLILALCALWPLRGRSAAVVLGVFGLAVAAIALIELLKTSGADQAGQFFDEARFAGPVGYTNANVGLWMLGLLPCVVLAGRRGVPVLLRGLFLGAAGLLAGAALLGQSRGWLMALPLVALLAIVVVPGRGRTIVALAAVGAAIALILGPLLDVYSELRASQPPGAVFDSALRALLLAGAGLAVLGALAAVVDERVQVPAARARRISAAAVAVAAVAAVGVVAGYAVVERNPFTAASDAWHEFKQGGYSPTDPSGRLTAGFSTYRYDYWRVAWSEFEDAPLLGAGADNFGRAYLRRGESPQRPQFPHSTEMVALAETGVVGALLLGGAFLCALLGALPGRRRDDLAGAAAGAGLLMFGYWLLHGTLDRFWEFPALSGPALAGLGVGVAVARGLKEDAEEPASPVARGRVLVVACAGGLLLAMSMVAPWLSQRDHRAAIAAAETNPEAALERLDRAAELNRLSPAPDRTAGLIELRRGHPNAAVHELRQASERDPGDSDLHFLLGLAESEAGRPRQAIRLVREALTLAPRDHVAEAVLRELRRAGRLDPLRLDPWTRADYRHRIALD